MRSLKTQKDSVLGNLFKNKQIAEDAILGQLEAIKKGEITDEEL